MKRIVASLLAVGALGAALPAAAAPWQNINQRQDQIERRIDRGIRDGSLTRREAANIRRQLISLERLEDRYRRNGLSNWERADLNRRFDALARQIRYERHDSQARNDRYYRNYR
jgi:hypothetical protein